MKIRKTLLIAFLLLIIAMCVNTASGAKLKVFKPHLTEKQMLDWLKEHNYKIERPPGKKLYSISWKKELPDGQITKIYEGRNYGDVLIESTDEKNTAYFTLSLSLGVNIDVIVSSECKLIRAAGEGEEEKIIHPQVYLPVSRYDYRIKNLQASDKLVTDFQVYFSRDLITRWGDIDIDHTLAIRLENPTIQISQLIGYTDGPFYLSSELEKRGLRVGSPTINSTFILNTRGYKSVRWSKDVEIFPRESPVGFELQFRSIPGIITARVGVDRLKRGKSSLTVKKDGKTINIDDFKGSGIRGGYNHLVEIESQEIEVGSDEMVEEILLQSQPQGKVVGPETIPADWNAVKLIQRLESLTSQCMVEGWLDKNAGEELKQLLVDSQVLLQKDQQTEAKQGLEKFITALKHMAERAETSTSTQEPPLTQEAVTLLMINAEYLLTKL